MSKQDKTTSNRITGPIPIAPILLLALLIPLAGCESRFINAAAKGNTATVKAMLAEGADVNQKGMFDWTALMKAATAGHTNTVQLLLSHGADLEAKSELGQTALMLAARENHCDVITTLVDKGADVNAKEDELGRAALIFAANHRCIEAVQCLLEHGAEVDARDKLGRTALLWAVLERPDYIAGGRDRQDFLIAYKYIGDAKVDKARFDTSEPNIVEVLLSHGADPTAREKSVEIVTNWWLSRGGRGIGRTALHVAAKHGAKSVVNALLNRGADVNVQDDYGWTPLMYATCVSSSQHVAIVEALVTHGANVHARDNEGRTAWWRAERGARYRGRREILRILEEAGAARDK